MKRWLIICDTHWCGTESIYSAITNDKFDLLDLSEQLAYDNFNELTGGFEAILEELFPDELEYTEEMENEAMDSECDFYSYNIEEWDESRPEEEWTWYELVYDGRIENTEPLDEAEELYNELDNISRT